MKVCPKCLAEFEDDFGFCRYDGIALQIKPVTRKCPECGKEVHEAHKFCPHCAGSFTFPIKATEKHQLKLKPETMAGTGHQQAQFKLSKTETVQEEKNTPTLDLSLEDISATNHHTAEVTEESLEATARPITSFHKTLGTKEDGTLSAGKRKRSAVWITVGVTIVVLGVVAGGGLALRGLNICGLFWSKDSCDSDIAQVVAADETNLTVSGPGAADKNRTVSSLNASIKPELDSLLSLFQQQLRGKPNLMGSLTLQLTIAESGRVTNVEEIASEIKDVQFTQAIIEEVRAWRFPVTVLGAVTVDYPILFIPPGFSVASIVKWQRSIGPRAGGSSSNPKPTTGPYLTLHPTSVYREAREDAGKVASIPAGIKVNVIAIRGDWLEVRSEYGSPPGFIRKDSAEPSGNR